MLKDTNLCMGCMNPKDYDGPCKMCGCSESDPCIPTYLEPKTFLNERYIVGRMLSYNGEGAIYIGYDTVTASKITIKEFMPDTLCMRRRGETAISVNANNSPLYKTYLSEFADLNRTLMKLRGMAHVQAVLDVFYENNTCYTVFEFISGISLKTYLANSSGGLMWEQVKELFPPILTTLSLVHAAGIIHRGISPQTIFVTDKMELKLAGFAITAARTTGTEIACEIFSGYAAPEQYSNEPNGTWTDVYGISAVLYKVLTGANPTEAIARTGSSMPEPALVNRNVPPNVSKAIMNGMRLSNDTRTRTITEFVDKLFAPPGYSDLGAHDENGRPITRKEERRLQKQKKERMKFLMALIMVGAVLIVFAVAFALTLSGTCAPSLPSEDDSDLSGSTSTSYSTTGSSEQSVSSDASSTQSSEQSSMVATINVPDFTDNYRYENAAAMAENIFTLVPSYDYNDEVPAGYIFEQSVEANSIVPVGTEIKVKVSKGKSVVPLPQYLMQDASDYVAELDKLNIKYEMKEELTNDSLEGLVLRCSKGDVEIAIGDPVDVANGETITVYVAKNFDEPDPIEDPNSEETSSSDLSSDTSSDTSQEESSSSSSETESSSSE